MPAKKMNLDFTKVKDGGNFNKKRIPAGDYLATVTKVEDSPAKGDGADQLLFSIKIDKHPSSVLHYYCKIQENQLWKLRNILIAAGKAVPKRKISVDPNSIVGKKIGVTVEDTYYEEKDQEQSEIGGVFPAAELDDAPVTTDDDEVDLDADDEDESTDIDDEPEAEEEAEEEVEEEAEEEAEPREGLDRTGIKRAIKALDGKATFRSSETDDDLFARLLDLRGAGDAEEDVEDEEEEEAPAPKKRAAAPAKKTAAKKKPAPAAVDDDDLEGIDIDDI